jgi:membrane fusion protein (multidrug efflux system)
MSRKLLLVLPVLGIALVAIGAWYWWIEWRFFESTDDAYVESDVSVISPRVAGYIKEVRVKNNERVKAGQVLFVIDDTDYAARVAQAEAVVASEEAAIATDESRLDLQRAMIEQAKADVAAAEAEQVRAKDDYRRYAQLLASDYASRQRFETARADNQKAAAALEQKRAALVAALGQLRVLRAERDEEKAKRAQAKANLDIARNDLANTVIRAPIAGVAGNRAGQIGQYVQPGTQLLSLVPLPRVYVTANFKETQLTWMRPGEPAEIAVDAYPGQVLKGRVESFAPGSGAEFSLLPPDNATGNFTKIVQRVPVRIAVPQAAPLVRLLRPGLSVTVTVDTRAEALREAQGPIGAAAAAPAPAHAATRDAGSR